MDDLGLLAGDAPNCAFFASAFYSSFIFSFDHQSQATRKKEILLRDRIEIFDHIYTANILTRVLISILLWLAY